MRDKSLELRGLASHCGFAFEDWHREANSWRYNDVALYTAFLCGLLAEEAPLRPSIHFVADRVLEQDVLLLDHLNRFRWLLRFLLVYIVMTFRHRK